MTTPTLNNLMTVLETAVASLATTPATRATDAGASAIEALEWNVSVARSAIHNWHARACWDAVALARAGIDREAEYQRRRLGG